MDAQVSRECSKGTTPGYEVPNGKRPKRFGPEEEVQKSPVVVTLDSLERSSLALSALEGAA